MQYLHLAIRCLLVVIFLVSSFGKISGRRAYGRFVTSVRDMGVLPAPLARPAAASVAAAETVVWLLLLVPSPSAARSGGAIATGLLCAFAAAVLASLWRGVRTPCRCFGTTAAPLGAQHVVRNSCLAAAAVLCVITAEAGGPVHASGAVVAVSAGLLGGALIVWLDDILGLFRPVGAQTR
ncbi:MauE/DoxX family redox-associated membrane protein [Streptomyces cahuitamycinicus]|uniref:Methylamine utilization protein MauE n=1 Tax=Streptomyces cahuitamycinicus TaxID=2070367 RepID=A0A2N8TN79_9ACTN|nr:MauE/DoxX family redox-associated membrane protein [Streptomyces cahuitamycinicus]PNG20443.1 methylamine utilization protein MauE [Streptomyces cahuitamycinicus]